MFSHRDDSNNVKPREMFKTLLIDSLYCKTHEIQEAGSSWS